MSQNIISLPLGGQAVLPGIILANSEAIKEVTPLTINSSGFLAGATSSGEKIYAYSIEDKTATSDNQTVAQYKPLMIDPTDVIVAITASGALAQTDIGEYGDISSNTAGVIVMGNPSTAGQFILVAIDADDSTLGYWRVAEPQQLAFAQA